MTDTLSIRTDLGCVWLSRNNEHFRIDPDEIPRACAELLASLERLEDAR